MSVDDAVTHANARNSPTMQEASENDNLPIFMAHAKSNQTPEKYIIIESAHDDFQRDMQPKELGFVAWLKERGILHILVDAYQKDTGITMPPSEMVIWADKLLQERNEQQQVVGR